MGLWRWEGVSSGQRSLVRPTTGAEEDWSIGMNYEYAHTTTKCANNHFGRGPIDTGGRPDHLYCYND